MTFIERDPFRICFSGSISFSVIAMVVDKGLSYVALSNGWLQRCERLTRLGTRSLISTITGQVVAIFIAEFHTTKGQH